MNSTGAFTSNFSVSFLQVVQAKKGTCFDMQTAVGVPARCIGDSTANKGVSGVTSPTLNAPHVNVQGAPHMKSQEFLRGRMLGL